MAWLAGWAGAAEPPAAPAAAEKKPAAETPAAPAAAKEAAEEKNLLAPLPAGEKIVATHAPFESGDCSMCHQKDDPKDPGPLTGEVNKLCLECHEDFKEVMARKSVHMPVEDGCGNCHNPHNSLHPKLLLEPPDNLCFSCHEETKALVTDAKVKHDALTLDKQCANCHNPHATQVEHLLIDLPSNLCLKCHSQDGVADEQGRKLVNFQKLLEENKNWHGPVVDKDCSACHTPHGGEYFRLLIKDYPAKFYSPYDPKLYALCFECHEESMLESAETDSLTRFRNGKQNLHYLHVHKTERGRTCRACHEVHASKQDHFIRESVPYGAKGWSLKINFTKTPTGGSCAKTCHATKSYTNDLPAAVTAPAPTK